MADITLTVNGKAVSGDSKRTLLDFLRLDLGLTAAKNGCGAGACGACTVIIDGKAAKACVWPLARLAGKSVTTLEGLSEREKAVYAWAFAKAGAVQCGFCIPGMVMAAKALLDANASPTEAEITRALRGNICRCTGYVKIKDAIRLAAGELRGEQGPGSGLKKEMGNGKWISTSENHRTTEIYSDSPAASLTANPLPTSHFPLPALLPPLIGADFPRVDAEAKTLGTGKYADDLTFPGMLFAAAVRLPVARAKVLSIDVSAAKAHADCEAVFTASDVPGRLNIGHLEFISDYDVMIPVGSETRFIGDALALVVSRRRETVDAIKALVKVQYETLPPLTTPEEAMAAGAPLVHPGGEGRADRREGNLLVYEHLVRGDAEAALAKCAHVVTRRFSTPFTEHAFMEPECAIARPDPDDPEGGLELYSAGQSVYDEQRECARMLGVERDKIHVKGQLVGGGFGGKEDMSVQHHACLAAWLLKKPVKVLLSRQESINVHPKRHAMEVDMTVGCDERGVLQAMKAEVVSDTGAYASLGGPVLQRACTHAAGPYNYQNIDIDGKAVYTNNPPGGAFRGFGVCQTNFAIESCLNLLAAEAGISPYEIRCRNAIRSGQVLPNGQVAGEDVELVSCLEAVKPVYEAALAEGKSAGIACGLKNAGVGVGLPDTGRCILSVEGGLVHIRTSAACIGQGLATVTTQITCDTAGLPPALVYAEPPDTRRTPNSGTTTASRQTTFTGEATRQAALKLKAALEAAAAVCRGGKPCAQGDDGADDIREALAKIEGQEFYGEFSAVTDPMGSGKPNPVSHVSYGYAATVAVLGADGRVERLAAAYDLGVVINPKSAAGQIEGGLLMGMGYALTEDFPLKDGVPQAKYGTLGLLRSTDAPEMDVVMIKPKTPVSIACGAKGVGELATIPVCPAIGGAYFARDGKLRDKLPMEGTPY